jgi:predicted membrane-bound dolichyl-phosphate-mannose-protein mannosyltransferase
VRSKRTLQIVLGLVGVAYLAMTYPLVMDLSHAKWLLVMKNETEPMFLSFFIALGAFLVLAVRKPFAHRSLILFAAWQSIAHASVMAIQTAQAWQNNVHRGFTDVVVVALIGSVLMAVAPAQQEPAEIVRQTGLEPALSHTR